MSLNPHLIPTGGIEQRVTSAIADLQRQMQNAIANMNEIPAGSISGSVGSGQIASGSISTPEIAAGAITTTTLAAGAVTTSILAAGAVTASTIAAGAITTGKLAAGAISASDIAAGVIAAHVITGTQISGTAIDGMTITGSTIRTSAGAGTTGAGVVIASTGIKGYNATPTLMFNLDSTTGLIQAQGVLLATSGSNIPTNTISGSLPAGGNRYSNSSFQDGASNFSTTGWTITNAAAATGGTTIPPVYGALSMQLTASASGNVQVQSATISDPYKRVVPGLNYSFQHYVYPTTTNRSSRIDVNWYNAAGALLSTTTGAAQPTTLNTWNEITQTATAPTNAAFALGVHYVAISAATSEVFYTECFQMEQGDRASAWQPRSDEILFAQINASNINVASLSAISANLGTITAGTITGTTITGGTIQTATSGARIAMSGSANQFQVIDSSGVTQVTLDGTKGVQLNHGSGPTQSIEWVNGTNPVGAIYAGGTGTTGSAALVTLVFTSASFQSALYLNVSSNVDSSNNAQVAVNNAAGTRLYQPNIIRGDGSSDFMQLPSTTQKIAMSGFGSFVGNGTASVGLTNWAHGLGVSPNCLIITPFGWIGYGGATNTTRTSSTFNALYMASTLGTFASGTTYFFSYYVSN